MTPESPDPTSIHTIVVTLEDLVSALELRLTSEKEAVLRVTPPFSGRMRARLHVELEAEYSHQPRPVHIDPETLVTGLPPYPRPAETEDELRADPDWEYSVEAHREYHARAVEQWRDQVPATIGAETAIETPDGPTTVTIAVLGDTESES